MSRAVPVELFGTGPVGDAAMNKAVAREEACGCDEERGHGRIHVTVRRCGRTEVHVAKGALVAWKRA